MVILDIQYIFNKGWENMKRFIKLFSILLFIFVVAACNNKDAKDINIIYTTDVHCGIEGTIGYSGVSAYKKELEKTSDYVSLVDCGDSLQGDYIGALSKGKYLIDIMNKMDYELLTIGNHEFDYGMDELKSRISEFNGDVLSCNIKYTGKKENKLGDVKPYKIIKYGNVKVGYVGVTTPTAIVESQPSTFKEDDEYVYDLYYSDYNKFYKVVQDNVDECKKNGANYVILLAHLGNDEPLNLGSIELCKNTSNIDIILDGHSHRDLNDNYKNKDGKDIPILDAGYKLNEFGNITIKSNGDITHTLVKEYDKKDKEIDDYISEINSSVETLGNKVLATSNHTLKITDEDGIRLVRSRETAIGNLIADSYSYNTLADISFVNGGGIRDNLNEGNLTFKDIMKIHPFGNTLCVIEAKGSQILDYLEYSTRAVKEDYKNDGKAYGENGAFPSVSNLKFSVDTNVEPSIEIDANGMFVKVTGKRRVKDVYVLVNGSYEAIDLNKTYTVSSHNYLLLEGGDGASMFKECKVIKKNLMLDYEAVVRYIVEELKGDIKTKYSSVDGRITIL